MYNICFQHLYIIRLSILLIFYLVFLLILSGLGRYKHLSLVSSSGNGCNTTLFHCLHTALDSGTDNHSKNVLRRYENFRRCQTPFPKHKATKPSRWLIFPLVLGAKQRKARKISLPLRLCIKIIAGYLIVAVRTANPEYYLWYFIVRCFAWTVIF